MTIEGGLTLYAGRDISLDAGRSQQFEETRRGRTHTIDSQTRVQSTTLDAGGDLLLQAGNDLRLTASQLQAGGSAALLAGNRIDLLTAQEEDYSLYESRSSGLFSSRHQRDEVRDIREVGTQISAGDDITLVSGGDQSYRGVRLDAGQDLALLSGGNIAFDMASDLRQESHERSRSSFVRQSASGEGTTRETLRQNELRYQGELIIQAAQGISIEVEGINAQSVRQTVEAMAAANPDLAWLQEMEQRGDIDWRHVEAIHDSWSYSQSGLGPGAALAISIVASAMGQHYVGQIINSAAVSAGAGSLAGTGAVSLANNRGDLGAALSDTFSSGSLRGAATAALSAGMAPSVDKAWGGMTNTTTNSVSGLDLGSLSGIGHFAGHRITHGIANAGLQTAINGGSFERNLDAALQGAVHHVVSGVLFNAVGDFSHGRYAEGSPEKIAMHALVGGLTAEAMGGDFKAGALAAGANEALVEYLDSHLGSDLETRTHLLTTASQLVGIVAAELVNGDVNDGAFIAAQATRYNYLSHQRVDEVKECLSGNTCSSKEEQERVMEEAEKLSQMLDEEMYRLCQQAPAGDACRTAINAATQYVAMRDAWAVMNGDVSRSSSNLFDWVYNSEGAEDRLSLYYNTINNRANFYGASDRYEQELGAGARWFGGAEFVTRARWTGLGANGEGAEYTFQLGSLLAGWNVGDIYDWRADAGNALMQAGFDNFRSLYNAPETDPVAWDIQQLQAEQKILQPVHEKYLSDRWLFTPLSRWATNSESGLSSWLVEDDMKQMPGGVDVLDYDSRIEYGCKLLGYDATQGCNP